MLRSPAPEITRAPWRQAQAPELKVRANRDDAPEYPRVVTGPVSSLGRLALQGRLRKRKPGREPKTRRTQGNRARVKKYVGVSNVDAQGFGPRATTSGFGALAPASVFGSQTHYASDNKGKEGLVEKSLPWMSVQVRSLIASYLDPESTVMLEYGGGGSTMFFRERVKQLYTVESVQEFVDRLEAKLKVAGATNVQIEQGPGGPAGDFGLGRARNLEPRDPIQDPGARGGEGDTRTRLVVVPSQRGFFRFRPPP